MSKVWNVEWPNVNTQRKYPFAEGQSLADGDFVLPDDLIVDMVLPVNIGMLPAIDPTLFHLVQLGVFSSGLTITLGYDGAIFSTVNIPKAGFTEYSTYAINGSSAFFDTRGWITIGQLDTIEQFAGVWNFTADTAKILPTIIRPNIRSVTSLQIVNGTDRSSPYTGDIILKAGSNMRLRVDGNTIYFDAIDGTSMSEECVCNDMDTLAPPIRTINAVGPNTNGELTLVGTSCVQLEAGTNMIKINDSCSEPCCDCRELEVVTDTLETMLNQLRTMEAVSIRLDEVITNTTNNVLASRTTGIPRS